MNTYRGMSEYGQAVYGGDVFEAEFSAIEERDLVGNGHLEIVPRAYKVLSARYEHKQGATFHAAFPVEREAALISGGHIKRAVTPTTKKG